MLGISQNTHEECKSLKKFLHYQDSCKELKKNPKTKNKTTTQNKSKPNKHPKQTSFRSHASRLRKPLWKSSVHFLVIVTGLPCYPICSPRACWSSFSLLIFLTVGYVRVATLQLLVSFSVIWMLSKGWYRLFVSFSVFPVCSKNMEAC